MAEAEIKLPEACDWQSLKEKSGTGLTDHYNDLLRTLGKKRTFSEHFCGALSFSQL